jgi:hypothetical protein
MAQATITKTSDGEFDEWLRRKRKISVRAAAELNDISEDTFRRRHSHLIKQVGPRRQAVELGDAIDLPAAP